MITRNQCLEELGLPTINKPEYNMYMSEIEPDDPEPLEPIEEEEE